MARTTLGMWLTGALACAQVAGIVFYTVSMRRQRARFRLGLRRAAMYTAAFNRLDVPPTDENEQVITFLLMQLEDVENFERGWRPWHRLPPQFNQPLPMR